MTNIAEFFCEIAARMGIRIPAEPLLRYESWGHDFPERKFLVIRRKDSCAGLFSYVATTLGWIKFAEENNMVPVIDMARHKNIYQTWTDYIFKELNSWKIFFEQPTDFDIGTISSAQNVVIADGVPQNGGNIRFLMQNAETLNQYRRLAKKYLHPRLDSLRQYENEAFNKVCSKGVIGVLARGTDFAGMHPSGHAVQPSAEELIHAVDGFMGVNKNARHVFLVTEDGSIAKRFKTRYGNALLLPLQDFVPYNGGLLSQNKAVAHSKSRGLAYLKAVIDLSRCDFLFSGINNGALGAMLLSDGFKFVKILDYGDYD